MEKKTIHLSFGWLKCFTLLVTILTLNRFWRAWKPACKKQNDRTSATSGRFRVEDHCSCRCSGKKDWYSARQAWNLLALIHPLSKNPSNKRPARWSGAWSSPPMIIAGRKELNSYPALEGAATLESTEFVTSSRNLWVSRRNSLSLFKYELPICRELPTPVSEPKNLHRNSEET